MDADFSIELGRDDPVLDFPWTDPAGLLFYYDLKRHPELITRLDEATKFPELAAFLRTVNSSLSVVESAKCDAWSSGELSPDEEIYGASHKAVGYVDLVFSVIDQRQSFALHEHFAKRLITLLRRTPETPSALEACIRRCYFRGARDVHDGFYCTLYISGYGQDEAEARQNWGIALKLAGNAVLQLSCAGVE